MLTEKRFDTGEVVLNFAEGPQSGPPLILFHGLPGRWQEFLPIINALTPRWQVFALDSRGQGHSGHVPGKYLPIDYIDDLISFIRGYVEKPAFILGMSAGGVVALCTASIAPDLVRGLVIGDSPIDMKALAAWMNSAPFAAHFSNVQDLIRQKLAVEDLAITLGEMPVRMMGVESPPKYREVQDQASLLDWAETIHTMDPDVLRYHAGGRGDDFLQGLDMDATLSKITCPTLLIRADPKLGALLSAQACEHAASLLSQLETAFLEDTGHSLGLDGGDVDPLMKVVGEFLERCRTEDQ